MFLHLSVSHSVHWVGGCLPLIGGCLPLIGGCVCQPQADTPLGRHPPCPVHARIHPLPSACWDTHLPAQCMLGYTSHCPVHSGIHIPPCPVHAGIHNPIPCAVHAGIWSRSGRHASHMECILVNRSKFSSVPLLRKMQNFA